MAQKEPAGLLTLRPVAWYRGLLPEKFGLPRQSGLVPELAGRVEMAEGFPKTTHGRPRYGHPGWGAMPGWESLPPVLLSGPILWDFPWWNWTG